MLILEMVLIITLKAAKNSMAFVSVGQILLVHRAADYSHIIKQAVALL